MPRLRAVVRWLGQPGGVSFALARAIPPPMTKAQGTELQTAPAPPGIFPAPAAQRRHAYAVLFIAQPHQLAAQLAVGEPARA